MRPFVVGIPTLNRPDLLRKCLESVAASFSLPEKILLVDNGSSFSSDKDVLICTSCSQRPVDIHIPGFNLGVAASWNWLWKEAGDKDIIILNDDVYLGPNTLGNLMSVECLIGSAFSYSVLRLTPELRRMNFYFDERFWPMYYEDNDHQLTLERNGINVVFVDPGEGLVHMEGGSNSKQDWMKPFIDDNGAKMERKWGSNWQTVRNRRPKMIHPVKEFIEFGQHLPRHPELGKHLLRQMGF